MESCYENTTILNKIRLTLMTQTNLLDRLVAEGTINEKQVGRRWYPATRRTNTNSTPTNRPNHNHTAKRCNIWILEIVINS
jgi:hypothetical protein